MPSENELVDAFAEISSEIKFTGASRSLLMVVWISKDSLEVGHNHTVGWVCGHDETHLALISTREHDLRPDFDPSVTLVPIDWITNIVDLHGERWQDAKTKGT